MKTDIRDNQVIGIYEKDIIIEVDEMGRIIKMNLNKDKTSVVLRAKGSYFTGGAGALFIM